MARPKPTAPTITTVKAGDGKVTVWFTKLPAGQRVIEYQAAATLAGGRPPLVVGR